MGFGTGLNALVTINEYLKNDKNHVFHYFTIEKYPVNNEEINRIELCKAFYIRKCSKIYQKSMN